MSFLYYKGPYTTIKGHYKGAGKFYVKPPCSCDDKESLQEAYMEKGRELRDRLKFENTVVVVDKHLAENLIRV